jgi:hypothetical protein
MVSNLTVTFVRNAVFTNSDIVSRPTCRHPGALNTVQNMQNRGRKPLLINATITTASSTFWFQWMSHLREYCKTTEELCKKITCGSLLLISASYRTNKTHKDPKIWNYPISQWFKKWIKRQISTEISSLYNYTTKYTSKCAWIQTTILSCAKRYFQTSRNIRWNWGLK